MHNWIDDLLMVEESSHWFFWQMDETDIQPICISVQALARNWYYSCWVPVDYWKYSRFGLPRVHLETDISDIGDGRRQVKVWTILLLSLCLTMGKECSSKWRIVPWSLEKWAKQMLCNRKGDSGLLWNIQLMQIEKNYFCASHNWHKLCVFVCVMTNRVCGNQNASHNLHLRVRLPMKSGICAFTNSCQTQATHLGPRYFHLSHIGKPLYNLCQLRGAT